MKIFNYIYNYHLNNIIIYNIEIIINFSKFKLILEIKFIHFIKKVLHLF